MDATDFRLMARLFGSSMHVPAKNGDQRGVISFWSLDANGFPDEAVGFLNAVTQEMLRK